MQMLEKAEVLQVEDLGANLFCLDLFSPGIAEKAEPAHFVMIRTSKGTSPLLCRPFSIYQSNDNGVIRILFRRIGQGTNNMSRFLPGEEIQLTGPLGNPFQLENGREFVLVGGGVGIAPIFMAASRLRQKGTTPISVLVGAATGNELQPLIRDFDKIGISCRLATDDGSTGHKGLVTDLLKETLTKQTDRERSVICCGPTPMMAAVAEVTNGLGVDCQVSLETMMACGISACLGCAVAIKDHKNYRHVCKDGPVFQADEIIWERLRN